MGHNPLISVGGKSNAYTDSMLFEPEVWDNESIYGASDRDSGLSIDGP